MNEEVSRVIMGYSKEGKKPTNALFSNIMAGGPRDEEEENNDIN